MFSGWRGLGVFWAVVVLLLAGAAGVLSVLGPLPGPVASGRPAAHAPVLAAVAPAVASKPPPVVEQHRDLPPADRPGRDTPGPIADPDPALLEFLPGAPNDSLPRIALDGRMPMQVYAAGFDRSTRRPRVGILLAGIGLNEADSNKAVRDLPGGVTFAVSPYAVRLPRLVTAARLAEHEYLLSLPMEPQGFPLNDPGPLALLSKLSPAANMDRLHALLARVGGYVGVTNALGELRGERFAGLAAQMDPLLREVAARGLLYVDARPPSVGGVPLQRQVWSRNIDLVLDEPVAQLDAKLAELERLARDNGDALGLVGAPRSVVVDHIAAWANGLLGRGLALAPVTALVRPPADVAVSAK